MLYSLYTHTKAEENMEEDENIETLNHKELESCNYFGLTDIIINLPEDIELN